MVRKTLRKAKGPIRTIAMLLVTLLFVLLLFSVLRASLFQEGGEERIWFEMTFLLLAAVIAELLIIHLKQPFVMVLLIVGVLISPTSIELVWPHISDTANIVLGAVEAPLRVPLSAPKLVTVDEIVSVFAQLGALILLFRIGMHSQVTQIFNLRNFAVAIIGIVLPFVAGYYMAIFLGGGFMYAMFMGAALTATSVGVTVAVLKEFKVMDKEFAKTILGAAVIDDILALLVLSFIVNIPEPMDVTALAPLAIIAGTAVVFVIGGILIGREVFVKRRIVAREFEKIGTNGASRAFLIAMAFAFFYAYVAEYIGLSGIVGIFIAGIVLNYSKAVKKLDEMMVPLEMLFTPIFFIALGMLIDVGSLGGILVPVLLLSFVAVATKVIGSGGVALLFGMGKKESLLVGVGMVPRGEIALIIALFGLTATTAAGEPALTVVEYTTIAAMAFVTTLVAPPALSKIIRG